VPFKLIYHAETSAGLQRVIGRMGAHVKRDGLLLVEPYFSPEQFDDSRAGIRHIRRDELSASEFHVSRRSAPGAELCVHYVSQRPETSSTTN